MARMSFSNESFVLAVVKAASTIADFLPLWWTLGLARVIGRAGYYLLPKKQAVMYANLRTVYAGVKSPRELRQLSKKVFSNFTQSCMEILSFRKIERLGLKNLVNIKGREHVEQALAKGKGVIYLAVHSGNWELASLAAGEGYSYHIVANLQSKQPRLAALLDQYRAVAGAKVISPGTATRDIVRALHKNEIVTLVVDQGGAEGMPVHFLGRTASMSTGAMRLGLKYGTVIIPVWIQRSKMGHDFTFLKPLDLSVGGDLEQAVQEVTARTSDVYSKLVYEHPEEYMWFYKVFKYSTERNVLVLDDGRTGHLRQSESIARCLCLTLSNKGKTVNEKTVRVDFKRPWLVKAFALFAFFAQYLRFLLKEEMLACFITPESYQALLAFRGDYVISCGSTVGSVNYFLSHGYSAKSICVLKSGLVSWEQFDLVVAPEHDRPVHPPKTRVVFTKTAMNLMSAEYLKSQSALLLNRYSHLKNNIRTKIGVLLGGEAKGIVFHETQARALIKQLKEAAMHFNADLLITTSRRTSPAVDAVISKEFKGFERAPLCIIANENNIPEAVGGILGLSDMLIVSGESVSMVSEAVSSGKRTIVFPLSGEYGGDDKLNKYDRFVLSLSDSGYILTSPVKKLGNAISEVMRKRFVFKSLDDQLLVRQAVEELVG